MHPRVFAIMYVTVDIAAKAVALPPPVRAKLLIAAPKLAQGVMAGVSDWYTWKLAEKVFGKRTKRSKAVVSRIKKILVVPGNPANCIL